MSLLSSSKIHSFRFFKLKSAYDNNKKNNREFCRHMLVTIHFNILSRVYHLTGTSCLSTHLGVDSLDILPLGNGTLVGTKTPLGKFINSLISGTSSSFDHIKDSPFVRRKASNLTGNFTAESSALAKFL